MTVVKPIPFPLAEQLVVNHHYMHRKPVMSWAFGLICDGEVRGVITYGTPASRHLQLGVHPDDPSKVTELNRMWIDDVMPTGTASWFIARTLKQLPARIVVSYADTLQGHLGVVYRAANFRYAGWTDMERKTARYDYLPLQAGAHTREAFRSGYGQRVRRKPKVRYWTVTGTPTARRVLAAQCRWPVLDWHTEPPPTQHRQRGRVDNA